MSWTCRLLDTWPEHPQPGDMRLDPTMIADTPMGRYCRREWLSTGYLERHLANRPPVWVYLPGGRWICVDARPDKGMEWQVGGDPPRITVMPAIHLVGVYCGWLIDGVLGDDRDGRTYDEKGA